MDEVRIGTVVGVDVRAFGLTFHHVGVVGDDRRGTLWIVSKSRLRGKVVEEPLDEFLDGADLWVHAGLRGRLPGHVVADRAYDRLGEAWSAWANCEHFVREVHGLRSHSPQLKDMIARIGVVGVIGLAAAPFGAGAALATSAFSSAVALGTRRAG